MAKSYAEDTPLQNYVLKDFSGGYNSYSASKLLIKDNEIPQGAYGVILDDNGSVTKASGSLVYGQLVSAGHSIMGMERLKTSTINKVIISCNTSWYKVTSTTTTALTGVTFSADKITDFCQADGKLWGANNTDNLAYTDDATTITSISSNGNVGRWPVYYNSRLYMTNSTYPDRIYYSNKTTISLSATPPSYTGFDTANMFNSSLPSLNSGFIILSPGSGIEITRLFADSSGGTDYIFAHTKSHGVWRIGTATNNSDGSLAHTITQIIPKIKSPAGRSVIKANNDQWFFDGVNFNTYGEAATYASSRVTPKGGRVKSEALSIAPSGRGNVAAGFYNSKLYFSYQTGTYNDKVIVYDTILNAWSSPRDDWKLSCFLEHEEDDGTKVFLGGSGDTANSYIYQLEVGTNNSSSAISSMFETKSTDCGKPGLTKYFGFVDIFYGMVYGTLTYEVFLDETSSVTGSIQLGNSTSNSIGIGSIPVGINPVGLDYPLNTTFASLKQNNSFRVQCQYLPGKRISIRFNNSNSNEQFKINSVVIYYIDGSIYQE